jgi:diguanylate cyclase (GGDEF)-like protein/PAS domain S-box-containing protein
MNGLSLASAGFSAASLLLALVLLGLYLGLRRRHSQAVRAHVVERMRLERAQREDAPPPEVNGVDAGLFRTVSDQVHEVVLIQGAVLRYVNPQFASLMGCDRASLLGRRFEDLVAPDQVDLVASNLRKRSNGEPAPERYEVDLPGLHGMPVRLEVQVRSIVFEEEPALLITGVEVIPGMVLSSPAPAAGGPGRNRARHVLDALQEAVITTDGKGRVDSANPAAARLLGRSQAELLGATLPALVTLVDESDRRRLDDPVQDMLASGARLGGQRAVLLAGPDGQERTLELTASPLLDAERPGAVILLRDVTAARGAVRQMSYQATHDALTGLVNRLEFERRLQLALDAARAGESTFVLVYIDLDHFKVVNDTSGHLAGDALLRDAARLMRDAVRDSDLVGRLGGDEFALLLTGCPLDKGRQIAEDLSQRIGTHRFSWREEAYQIGASCGLVELGRDSGSLEDALAAADSACYMAKRQGSGKVAVYSARDEVVARQSGEIQWLQALQTAIRDNRFRLFGQPIVPAFGTASTGGPALEILVRMIDTQGNDVAPADFLRPAERYRLMSLIDRWVVQATLTAASRGEIPLPEHGSIAINIAGQTLADPQFLEFVVECFDLTGVSPSQVCFELSESSVTNHMEQARRFIAVLQGMGCQFALDDFGSDLGSFNSLRSLPIDFLKIDGSFMQNLPRDNVNQAVVTAMIRLARTLKFRIIAEQVEDQAAMDAARAIGVDFLQGYAVGRPQPLTPAAA